MVHCLRKSCANYNCKHHERKTNLTKDYLWRSFEDCKMFITEDQLKTLGGESWLRRNSKPIY